MNRRVLACAAAIVVAVTMFVRGAGKSDLADAAMKGDKAAVRALLAQKADVNAPQIDGATALHWAIYRDDEDLVVRDVLDSGHEASLEMGRSKGGSALPARRLGGTPRGQRSEGEAGQLFPRPVDEDDAAGAVEDEDGLRGALKGEPGAPAEVVHR